MKKIFLYVLITLNFVFNFCKDENDNIIKKFSIEEIEKIIDEKDIILIDTREYSDTKLNGYIKNSILFDSTHKYKEFFSQLISKDSKLIFITKKGNENISINIPKELGYSNILGYFNFEDWQNKGKELYKINMINGNQILEIINNKENIIVDTREINEYKNEGIIRNSLLIPFSKIKDEYIKIPKDKNIYFLCKVGFRGVSSLTFLKRLGYKNNLYNFDGGFVEIKKSGFIIENYNTDL
jgi:rhodanese-related sulfurtransferase